MATTVAYLRPGAMETSFYHDEVNRGDGRPKQGETVKKLKTSTNGVTSRPMSLDFTGAKKKDQKAFTPLLSSPDLNMLKLASPDLERLIIQQNGQVTTTPTPSGIMSVARPTEEQEAYARGFVDALNELHQKTGQPLPIPLVRGASVNSNTSTCSTATTLANNENSLPANLLPTSSAALPLTTTTSLPGGVIQFTSQQQSAGPLRTDSPLYTMSMQATPSSAPIKEEMPQTVPCIGATPMSPIDMENQERIKLERKRARNRVAARKCRTRKLERISRLESRVSDLKGQNTDLQCTANSLRDQVCQLKKQIMQHVSNGCQLMSTSNLL